MESKVIEILDEMARLLTEKGWTQGVFARTQGGAPTDCRSDTACSFCLRGALKGATADLPYNDGTEANYRLHRALGEVLPRESLGAYLDGHVDIISFNDTPGRTREEVLDLIERAKRLEVESAD